MTYCLNTLVIVQLPNGETDWVEGDNEHYEDSRDIAGAIETHYKDMQELCDGGDVLSYSITHFTVIHP